MGEPTFPPPSLPVYALLARDEEGLRRGEGLIASSLGEVSLRSPVIPFTYTSYYEGESGASPRRRFFALRDPIDPSRLMNLKLESNALELAHAPRGRRIFNIDPGVLGLGSLVVASTKAAPHRVYVGGGIHAHLMLLWRRRGFEPLPWTYPDYRTAAALSFFSAARSTLKKKFSGRS